MTSTFDFENNHVQKELTGASFVKGETTLIAAGPPFLSAFTAFNIEDGVENDFHIHPESGSTLNQARLGGIPVFPIGVIENANIGQSKQLRRIAEVGSKRFHFVTGRNLAQMSLARVLFNGPSLLRVLYAYVGKENFSNNANMSTLLDNPQSEDIKILSDPGYADFFINLDSSLFDVPFGLMFYLEDAKKKPYGAYYCTECYIQTHQFNVGASADVIAEGVTIQFDRAVPIEIGATGLGG
jgi:hypothetical protein